MSTEKLIIFLKAPRPGAVKTRLIPALGSDGACAAYRQLVEVLLGQLALLAQVELRFTPDDAANEMEPWAKEPGWQTALQGTGDLGERLVLAFQSAFAAGAQRVVVIGSDSPEVMPRDIEEAWSALRTHDLVLGPATDGGYWLIGLRAPQPAIFQEISWSTPGVLRETLGRARAAQFSIRLLRRLTDVDTEVEWNEFVRRFE